MLLPTLLSLPPAPLPTTLIAEVIDASGARVVGAVDAPMWLMPLAAAGCGLIPVSLLALSKGAAPPAGAVASASAAVQGARDRVQGARDRVFSIANKYPKLRRRLRRERLLMRRNLAVLDTEEKGKGLFAQQSIPGGTYLFDYEGEELDLPAYQSRYPDRVSDYAVGIKMPDGGIKFVDAADERKSGLARFINHSRRRANVRRATKLDGEHPRVLMYTTKPIQAGEELQWDYGEGYWQAQRDRGHNMVED